MQLADSIAQYWHASSLLNHWCAGVRRRAAGTLHDIARYSEHDRLRCAAAGRLVSVGLTPEEGMTG